MCALNAEAAKLYKVNTKGMKCVRQVLIIWVEDFSTLLSSLDRYFKIKLSAKPPHRSIGFNRYLQNIPSKRYGIHGFSVTPRLSSKIDHIRDHSVSLNRYKVTKIIPCIIKL